MPTDYILTAIVKDDNLAIKILKSEFVYSVPTLTQMHRHQNEVAFVGRSNAGKSSLINAICAKKDLARTSKTPGRTRHAVVYDVLFASSLQEKAMTLVDLPGFGFASMSKAEAEACENLIFSYIKKRQQIVMLVLLLDIRREVDERELQIINLAKDRNIDFLLVLTKCDKVALAKRKPIVTKLAKELSLSSSRIFLHSNTDEKYAHALQKVIFEAL